MHGMWLAEFVVDQPRRVYAVDLRRIACEMSMQLPNDVVWFDEYVRSREDSRWPSIYDFQKGDTLHLAWGIKAQIASRVTKLRWREDEGVMRSQELTMVNV
jgi:hypothetical protein